MLNIVLNKYIFFSVTILLEQNHLKMFYNLLSELKVNNC